jgi:hypothetical protein
MVCLMTKGRQFERNFKELKPASQVTILGTILYRCLLPSSGTVKMDYKENMENACYATNDDTPL